MNSMFNILRIKTILNESTLPVNFIFPLLSWFVSTVQLFLIILIILTNIMLLNYYNCLQNEYQTFKPKVLRVLKVQH